MDIFRWTWDPLEELRRIRREAEGVFRRYGRALAGYEAKPPVNVHQDEEGLTLTAEVQGVRPEDLAVEAEGNVLRITTKRSAPEGIRDEQYHRRERSFGEYTREFRLPGGLDTGKVEAALADGVLTVRLPKAESAKPRRIEVTSGG